jgi:hypothetical protein
VSFIKKKKKDCCLANDSILDCHHWPSYSTILFIIGLCQGHWRMEGVGRCRHVG